MAKKFEQDQKILELQDQIETQEEFNKHLKELQHEKSILSTLISDDKMKSEVSCKKMFFIQFKVLIYLNRKLMIVP